MSQTRQADKDRQQATYDYGVNLKAELEIMELHEKIELLKTQEPARMPAFRPPSCCTLLCQGRVARP